MLSASQGSGALTCRLVSVTIATNRYRRCRGSRRRKLFIPICPVLKHDPRTHPLSFVLWYHQISAICLWTISLYIGGNIHLSEIGRPSNGISRPFRRDGLLGRFG